MTATDFASALALVCIVVFLGVLIQKEMLSGYTNGWQRILARGLYIAIIPLGIAFVMIAGNQVIKVLR